MSFLSQSESTEILSVLKGGLDKTFESVTLSIGLLFRREIDKFKACCGLVFALLDDFLDPRQRLFALYALLELHRDKPPNIHPFWEFLLRLGTDSKSNPAEVELIHLFIVQNRGIEVSRSSVNEFLSMVHFTSPTILQSHQSELHQLIAKLPIEDKGIGFSRKSGVHRVMLNSGQTPNVVAREEQGGVFMSFARDLGLSGFEPKLLRPPPPIFQTLDIELQWLDSMTTMKPPPLMWDCGNNEEIAKLVQVVKDGLRRATESPLLPHEQQDVLQHLKTEPQLVFQCELEPAQLAPLVENAPTLAIEILRQFIPSPLGDVFMTQLASLEMSLHSMQVVNDLVTSIALPSEFIQEYISNCIQSCNAIEDHFFQHRQVRVLCVFIQSLTKAGVLDMADLIHEIQTFCVDHAKIKEASELFKILRDIEKSQDFDEKLT
eukprot:g8424.t1